MKSFIFLSLSLIYFYGCSHSLTGNRGEPKWVASPQPGGESLFGKEAFYGKGESNLGDIDGALLKAQDEARNQAGAALQTEIQKISKKTHKVLVTSLCEGASEAEKTKLSESIKNEFHDIEKNLVNVNVRGSKIVSTWTDKEKILTFALAKIDKTQAERSMLQEFTEAATRAVKTQMNVEESRIQSIVQSSLETAISK
jgi:hypothetical protein